jgi:GPI-GlcNAc transferase complex, PIG-H component
LDCFDGVAFAGFMLAVCLFVMIVNATRNRSMNESLLLFPEVGLQISRSGSQMFIQASEVECFAMNEAFERCRVVVYLTLVKTDKRCLVLFDQTRPSVESLISAFETLDAWLVSLKRGT